MATRTAQYRSTDAARRRGGRGRGRRRRGWALTTTLTLGVVALATGAGWAWLHGSVGTLPLREHCTAAANGATSELDPEQAGNAAIIAAVAVHRALPARAASIAIATAMQESKLRNLTYGDRDSLGLFQQRPSQGWGTAAQVQDPVYAANAFYDAMVKIPGYLTMPITTVAQEIQRSGFPAAYASHEPAARIFASALTGYSTGALSCVLLPVTTGSPAVATSTALTDRAAAVVAAAHTQTGDDGVAGSRDGTAVRFTVATGADADRLAWALAQWAVGQAADLDIVGVEVDGRRWQRSRPDLTWSAGAATTARGTVLVRVAPGS